MCIVKKGPLGNGDMRKSYTGSSMQEQLYILRNQSELMVSFCVVIHAAQQWKTFNYEKSARVELCKVYLLHEMSLQLTLAVSMHEQRSQKEYT